MAFRFVENPDKFIRRTFIGGSDARIIMGSDEAALVQLWREKRGEAEPQDLSGNLIVQLGTATEELNRTWYERNTGRSVGAVQNRVQHNMWVTHLRSAVLSIITGGGKWVEITIPHSAIPWMVATLDGLVEETGTVLRSQVHAPLVVFLKRLRPKSTWPRFNMRGRGGWALMRWGTSPDWTQRQNFFSADTRTLR